MAGNSAEQARSTELHAAYILDNDNFSRWLGVEIIEIRPKYCKIKMVVREEMINALGTVHGGVTFAFADSALAFCSNNTGEASVALQCSINFTTACHTGDVLTAESTLVTETKKTGVYDITVSNDREETVAAFRGTVYKIGKPLTKLT